MDVMALAKYMRCLFQIAQSDNVEVAEELLNQIAAQAAEAHQVFIILQIMFWTYC